MGHERHADAEVMRDSRIVVVKFTVTCVLAGTEIAARSNVRFSALTSMVIGPCACGVGGGLVGRRGCVAVTWMLCVDVGATSVGAAVEGRGVMVEGTGDGCTEPSLDEVAVAPGVDEAS